MYGKENPSFEKCCYKIVVKFFSRALLQCETDVFLTFTHFEYGQQEFSLKNKCYKIVVKFFSRALLQCENDVFLTFFTFWTRTAIFMSISILFNFIASYYNLLFANNYLCFFFSTDSIIKESHFANFPNSDSNVKKWTFCFYKGIDNNWKFR